ncbi:hypothetical protein P0F65_00940 [Sphingomonas sp. I4]
MMWLALLLQAATPGSDQTVTVTARPAPLRRRPLPWLSSRWR